MRSLPLLLLCLFPACAGTPTLPEGVPVPDEKQREQDLRQAEEKRRNFNAVLLRLDQAIESYVQAINRRGEPHADQQAERIEKLLRETVLDIGPIVAQGGKTQAVALGDPARPSGENFRLLQAQASDGTIPAHQGIALAALGFSGKFEMMPLILQGAQLSDPNVVDHAVLGLAILRSPTTPPGVLAAIVEDEKHPEDGRSQAAWALHEIQTASEHPDEIVALWRRFLNDRQRMPTGVIVQSVRGLGLARDTADADLVASLLDHPTARVRMAAALALGRMNAQSKWPQLVDLLSPRETVQNVRLHARKALVELAGGLDYGYDLSAWRKTFDREQR